MSNNIGLPGGEALTGQRLLAVGAGEALPVPRVIAVGHPTLGDHLQQTAVSATRKLILSITVYVFIMHLKSGYMPHSRSFALSFDLLLPKQDGMPRNRRRKKRRENNTSNSENDMNRWIQK